MRATAIRKASALALIVALGGLGACGSDDDEPAASETATPAATQTPAAAEAPAGEPLALTAGEEGGLSFDPGELSAEAGSVTVSLENPDGNQMPHNVVIEGNGVEEAGEVVEPGGTSTATAELEAGTYTFYCAVGQHRQNGMEGSLTVE